MFTIYVSISLFIFSLQTYTVSEKGVLNNPQIQSILTPPPYDFLGSPTRVVDRKRPVMSCPACGIPACILIV